MQKTSNIIDIYPLSPMQEGMLFSEFYDKNDAYFQQFSYRIRAKIDGGLLKKCFETIVARYDVLRTAFIHDQGERPLQVVLKNRLGEFIFSDIKELDGVEKEKAIENYKLKDKHKGFDLKKGDLIRLFLCCLAPSEYVIILSFHHIIMDGWCTGILIQELFQIYFNSAVDKIIELPKPRQYKTYIKWLEKQNKDEALKYWENYLDGFNEITHIAQSNVKKGYEQGKCHLVINKEYAHKLFETAEKLNVTLASIIQASWGLLLGKYNDNNDIVFGLVVSGRPAEISGIENMLGNFINAIPVRIKNENETKLGELITSVYKNSGNSSRYDYISLAEIQSKSKFKNNLVDHVLVFENLPTYKPINQNKNKAEESANMLSVLETEIFEQTNYEFYIEINISDIINIDFIYNKELYKKEWVENISGHFEYLLNQVTYNIEKEIGGLNFLSENEQNKILKEFNNTKVPFNKNKSIIEYFEENVENSPNAVAIVFEDNIITYSQLNNRVNKLAQLLIQKGSGPDKLIAVLLERCDLMMISILAIWKSGGAYIPLDIKYPEIRIKEILDDSKAIALISKASYLTGEIIQAYPDIIIDLDKEENFTDNEIYENPKIKIQGDSLSYIIYTSGSTGKPKGVMVEHIGMLNHMLAKINHLEITQNSVIAQNASQTFDISVWQFFVALIKGAHTVIISDEEIFNTGLFAKRIHNTGVNILELVPSYLSMLLGDTDNLRKNLKGLKYLLVTGEELKPALANNWLKVFKNIPVINAYGPTEASDDITHYFIKDKINTDRTPIGKPLQNFNIYIVDKQNNLAIVGMKGEICVSGIGVGRGYFNDKDKTSAAFSSDPFSDDKQLRMYRTGDIGRWLPDGNIEFFGRMDYQVKIRGFRIELHEIESVLQDYPGVTGCVVIDLENNTSEKYLCAYYVCSNNINLKDIKNHLKKSLPYYMVPEHYIRLEKLPLNSSGKVNRNGLPKPVLNFINQIEPPRNDKEHTLLEIWQNVLANNNFGIYQNFFMLGGDSIKSIQIISRLYKKGYKIEVRDIFENPTVAELAQVLKPIDRIPDQSEIKGDIPLTPVQYKFFEKHITYNHYNLSVMLHLPQKAESEIILEIFNFIVRHHDALRITFNYGNKNVTQYNQDNNLEIDIKFIDLTNNTNAVNAVSEEADKIQGSVDIQHGPLIKLGHFRLVDGDRLLVVVHHLVTDAVSWRIIFEDLETLFKLKNEKKKLELPLKTDSFKFWSEKINTFALNNDLKKEFSFWNNMISNGESIQHDIKGNSFLVKDNESISLKIEKEESSLLLHEVNNAFNTNTEDILITALALAVKDQFRINNVLIELEGHGRENLFENIDISRTVGWFTSFYPVLIETGNNKGLEYILRYTKEVLRNARQKSLTYGIIKYITSKKDNSLKFQNKPVQLGFNYLGQFNAGNENQLINVAGEPAGNSFNGDDKAEFELEAEGFFNEGNLTLRIEYNKKYFKKETIQSLLESYQLNLKEIIKYCADRIFTMPTPSDFTYKKLTLAQLDILLEKYKNNIDDLYTLTPLQNGILFHYLAYKSSAEFFEQYTFKYSGKLNIDYIKESLKKFVHRHDILRTSFYLKNIDESLQIVLKTREIDFEYIDVSNHKHPSFAIDKLKNNDLDRGFDLENDILLRLKIIKIEEEVYQFIWGFHHIIMDGWCIGIIKSEFLEIYSSIVQQRDNRLAVPTQYKRYIKWLEKYDVKTAGQFWTEYLEGYTNPARLPKNPVKDIKEKYSNKKQIIYFDDELTKQATTIAQSNNTTIGIVMQVIYGIIVSRYSGYEDVVFGIVVAGRPPEIENVNMILGLFINILPVRINFNKQAKKFSEVLSEVQLNQIERDKYQHTALVDIQSGHVLKNQLFDTIISYQNYQTDSDIYAQNNMELQVNKDVEIYDGDAFEQINYDLNIMVNPGKNLSIVFLYNENVYSSQFINSLGDNFKDIIKILHKNSEIAINNVVLPNSLKESNTSVDEFDFSF